MFPIKLTPEGQKAFRLIRKYLYAVTLAVVALLVFLDKFTTEEAPLILNVAAAILGFVTPATALANLTPIELGSGDPPQVEDGGHE